MTMSSSPQTQYWTLEAYCDSVRPMVTNARSWPRGTDYRYSRRLGYLPSPWYP